MTHANTHREEPRWPVLAALVAIGCLNFALPEPMSPGPRWGLLVVVLLLAIPGLIAHRTGRHELNQVLGVTLLCIITGALIYALTTLVLDLISHKNEAVGLLRGAVIIWSANILTFASWYWRLDAGGPHRRGHHSTAFLFPQMTLGHTHWRAHFIDYLFLAFNTSTAFSPTDAPVLSRWAKGLMIVQSSISLTSLAVVAARAVNIL